MKKYIFSLFATLCVLFTVVSCVSSYHSLTIKGKPGTKIYDNGKCLGSIKGDGTIKMTVSRSDPGNLMMLSEDPDTHEQIPFVLEFDKDLHIAQRVLTPISFFIPFVNFYTWFYLMPRYTYFDDMQFAYSFLPVQRTNGDLSLISGPQQGVRNNYVEPDKPQESIAAEAVVDNVTPNLGKGTVITAPAMVLKKAGLTGKKSFSLSDFSGVGEVNFMEVDRDRRKEIIINSVNPVILSSHPSDSYEIKKYYSSSVIIIVDSKAFWSKTDILVIQL